MKVYIRKIDKQCITHQISVLTEVVEDFFDSKSSISIIGKNNGKNGSVSILSATDYRLGGDIKNIIKSEGGVNIDDYIVFYKSGKSYLLEVVTKNNYKYSTIDNLFEYSEKHLTLDLEENKIKDNENTLKSLDFNLYGIHMKDKNSALSDDPHICIGWSELGDLTNIKSKDELKIHFKSIYPDATNQRVGQCVTQIWKFIGKTNIGDYVIFSDGPFVHIGQITSNYYFDNNVIDQSADYVNNRKVNWLKKYIKRELLSMNLKKSLMSARSYFKLNDNKSVVLDLINNNYEKDDDTDDSIVDYNYDNSPIKDGKNLVIYGTPGCGKSYYVQNTLLKDYKNENIIRTTFYQDYSNSDFVGQILPKKEGKDITYDFFPGPFTIALEKAINSPDEKIALVIEELNRGAAASIFGDIFQLLDRKNGVSEYPIINTNVIDYLNLTFDGIYKFNDIKIPSNMSIIATMNTSDQNVFTLDTAFKRRWNFVKLANKFTKNHEYQDYLVPGMTKDNITWKDLVLSINNYMISKPDLFMGEDKQIGIYFVDKDMLLKKDIDAPTDEKAAEFAYKVLEYIWDDVAKYYHSDWFNKVNTFDDLIEEYLKNGKGVFKDGIIRKENQD